jgi:uncharacterized repeat protein (TIGR01451 family)
MFGNQQHRSRRRFRASALERGVLALCLAVGLLSVTRPTAGASVDPTARVTGTIRFDVSSVVGAGEPLGDFSGRCCFETTQKVSGVIHVSLKQVARTFGNFWVDDGTSYIESWDAEYIEKQSYPNTEHTCTTASHFVVANTNWKSLYDAWLAAHPTQGVQETLTLAQAYSPGLRYNPAGYGPEVFLWLGVTLLPASSGTFTRTGTGPFPGDCEPVVNSGGTLAPGDLGGAFLHGRIVDTTAAVPSVVFDTQLDAITPKTPQCGCHYSEEHTTISGVLNGDGNAAPEVTAGDPVTGNAGAPVTLNGAASDDGRPNPPAHLTTQWSTTSAPDGGTVAFGDPSSPVTTATFSKPGHYELVLTASDGQRSANARVGADMRAADFDLELTQTSTSTGGVVVGQTVNETLVVRNKGPDAATGVSLVDRLPTGAAPATATTSTGTCAGFANVTCTLGELPAGGNATVNLTWRAPLAAAGTSMPNHAETTADGTDATPTDNILDATFPVALPTAAIKISEAANKFNTLPDTCARLRSIFVGQGAKLLLEVRFPFALTEPEKSQIQWDVTGSAATPSTGTLAGQPTIAQVAVTSGNPPSGGGGVTVSYNGKLLPMTGVNPSQPDSIRVVTDAARASALSLLTAGTNSTASFLPLAADLLSRFLAVPIRTATGVPSIRSRAVDICEPELTHRAGANWGPNRSTTIPLVSYASGSRASRIVADGVAGAVLALKRNEIQAYMAAHRGEARHTFPFTSAGNLSLEYSPDVYAAVHGATFTGSVTARIDRVGTQLRADRVEVQGTVVDLYDFDINALPPAPPAAKVQISSVGKPAGHIFWDQFQLAHTLTSLGWFAEAR